ncbi:MAG: ABC transporter substrate-binding protein [Pseudomonadota bacterium]
MDWELNCQFAGVIWAMEAGLFERAGLLVDVVPPSRQSGAPVLDLIAGHGAAVGTVEENLVMQAAAAGHGVRAVGAMLQRSPLVLMARGGVGVQNIGDLHGRRVAMHADGAAHLRAILALHDIDPAGVHITVGGWSLGDLEAGQFDAVQGYAITEAHTLGQGAWLIPLHHPKLSPSSIVMAAGAQTLKAQGAQVQAMVRAVAEGWRCVLADPARAADHVAAVSREHSDPETNMAILSGIGAYANGPAGICGLDRSQWSRNLETLADNGLVPGGVGIDTIIWD